MKGFGKLCWALRHSHSNGGLQWEDDAADAAFTHLAQPGAAPLWSNESSSLRQAVRERREEIRARRR